MHHDDDAHLAPVDELRIFALTRPDPRLFKLYLIYSVIANVAFPVVFLPLYFRFITLRYRFDEEGVAVSHGLLWRKETYLTYARIQDIHVTRGVFERWLGIGTVEIQTASGNAGAEQGIVGVTQFDEIRNFLYARMRGHHLHGDAAPAGVEASVGGAGGADAGATLCSIRDELRAIREIAEARGRV